MITIPADAAAVVVIGIRPWGRHIPMIITD
jgi:hypothetical protein